MKRTLKIAVPAVALILMSAATFGGEEKVTICHYPPGNPSNVQVITVGASAVPAHIAQHGDQVYSEVQGGGNDQCPQCGNCPGPSGGGQ